MADSDDQPIDTRSIEEKLRDAEESKVEGTEHFKAARWSEALVAYQHALANLPPRPSVKGKERAIESDEEADDQPAEEPEPILSLQLTGTDAQVVKTRAVLNGNISACYIKLGEHKNAVDACTNSLLDDPLYAKVLQRRASANEVLNTWSSLSQAQEDYNALLEIHPPSSAAHAETRRALARLKPRVEAAQKAETDEMMSKLKDLGNSVLGNFGLSTDNFKMTPNGAGGYSMNFVR